jgi:dual specificity tyrosine-phosphorylation-regulated kinase 2/3/4
LNDEVYFCSFKKSTGGVDDADGYLTVEPGDHILYRFEVKNILGKGSFAQVVSAYDHKEK